MSICLPATKKAVTDAVTRRLILIVLVGFGLLDSCPQPTHESKLRQTAGHHGKCLRSTDRRNVIFPSTNLLSSAGVGPTSVLFLVNRRGPTPKTFQFREKK
ncbi:hypothetical protein PS2_021902 [Malus domestica]